MLRNLNESHLTFSMNCYNQEVKGENEYTLKLVLDAPSIPSDILKFNF